MYIKRHKLANINIQEGVCFYSKQLNITYGNQFRALQSHKRFFQPTDLIPLIKETKWLKQRNSMRLLRCIYQFMFLCISSCHESVLLMISKALIGTFIIVSQVFIYNCITSVQQDTLNSLFPIFQYRGLGSVHRQMTKN